MEEFDKRAASSKHLDDTNEGKKDRIYCLIKLGEKLFCFTHHNIKEVQTAEMTDLKNEHLKTQPSYQKIYDIGTTNPIVARTIIQSYEILKNMVLRQGLDQQSVLEHVWTCSRLLLNCEKSYHKIFTQTNKLMYECDSLIKESKSEDITPELPQVENLEQEVTSFLENAKQFLEATHQLLCIFYDAPNYGSDFESYYEWLNKNKNDNEKLLKMLGLDKDWLKRIFWSKSALDTKDSSAEFKLNIYNFKLHQDSTFSNPSWCYDFREKEDDYFQEDASDILVDMNIYLKNMLTFFEELFLLCVDDSCNENFKSEIFKRASINPECPTVYFAEVDLEKMFG